MSHVGAIIGGVGAAVGGAMLLNYMDGTEAPAPEIEQAKVDDKEQDIKAEAKEFVETGQSAFEKAGLSKNDSPEQAAKKIAELIKKDPAALNTTQDKLEALEKKMGSLEEEKEKLTSNAKTENWSAKNTASYILYVGGAVVAVAAWANFMYQISDSGKDVGEAIGDTAKGLGNNIKGMGDTAESTAWWGSKLFIGNWALKIVGGAALGAFYGSSAGPVGIVVGGLGGAASANLLTAP